MPIAKKDLVIAAGLVGIAAGAAWSFYKRQRKSNTASATETKAAVSKDRIAAQPLHPIEKICKKRGIQSLYHFTKVSSLPSILEHGLLSHQAVKEMHWPLVDPYRHDGREDHICLSVSHPNSRMLYKLSHADQSAWCILKFPITIAWERDCLFTPTNAANKEIQAMPEEELRGDAAFERMFMQQIGNCTRSVSLASHYPTDVQAEVMCPGRISPQRISAIYFYSRPNSELEKLAQERGLPAMPFRRLYQPRIGDKAQEVQFI